MSDDRIRLRTPWLDEQPGRRRMHGPFPRVGPHTDAKSPGGNRPGAPGRSGRPRLPEPPGRTPGWATAIFVAFGAFAVGVLALAGSGNGEALGAVVTGPLLLVITYVVAKRFAEHDDNPVIVPIIMAGLCLKLIASYVRYKVSASVYGTGDFFDYNLWGHKIGASLRAGHFLTPPGRVAGTNFMRILTGFIYFLTPSRLLSGFAVYSFLGFVGVLFFWRAYRVAFSAHNDTTYLKWVVLMPSLVYWPAAIGKDAFMLLAAGVAAYGVACLLVNRTSAGVVAIAAGIGGMVMVRPHFALAVCGGLALAVVVRQHQGDFFRTIASLAFVVALGFVVVHTASSFFGISAFNQSSIVKSLNDASAQSSEGGSAFTPVVVTSPVKFPLAAATVLYRPLPFEAHSPQELLTALEGTTLIVLTIRALKRSWRGIRLGRQLPYLIYCLGALIVFIVAFSGFSNFGLLARERTVIQPLFLVFLSLPRDVEDLLPERPVPRPRARVSTRPRW